MDNGKSHDNPHRRFTTTGPTGTVEDEKPRNEPPTDTGSSAAMGKRTSPIHAILTKARSARKSGNKSAAPTLQFESDDSGSEGDMEEREHQEMDRLLEEKRRRREQNPQERPGHYVYSSDRFMNGPAEQEPRLPGEDPAADELFERKSKAGQAGPAGVGLGASGYHDPGRKAAPPGFPTSDRGGWK